MTSAGNTTIWAPPTAPALAVPPPPPPPAPVPGRTIGLGDVEALGRVDDALGAFYVDQITRASAVSGVPVRLVREWFEDHLITELGFRTQVLDGPAGGRAGEAVLRSLENGHLIRAEARRGARWYELAHDRLVAPIQADNAAWRAAHLHACQVEARAWDRQNRPPGLLMVGEALASAETWAAEHPDDVLDVDRDYLEASRVAQRQLAAVARASHRNKILAVVSTGLAAAALVALLFALGSRQRAASSAAAAQRGEQAAAEARTQALANATRAEEQSRLASQRADEAAAAAVLAEQRRVEAENAKAQAQSEAARAEAEKQAALDARRIADEARAAAEAANEQARAEQQAAIASAAEAQRQRAAASASADAARTQQGIAVQQKALAEEQRAAADKAKARTLESLFLDLRLNPGDPDAVPGSICLSDQPGCVQGRPVTGIQGAVPAPAIPKVLGDLDVYGRTDAVSKHFVVSAEWGKGRVVAFAHNGLISDEAVRQAGTAADNVMFVDNALRWLRRSDTCATDSGQPTVALFPFEGIVDQRNTRWLGSLLKQRGWTYKMLVIDRGVPLAPQLRCVSAVVWGNAWTVDEAQLRDMVTYVRDGGGLLLAGLGWSWTADNRTIPGSTGRLSDYPANRLGRMFGFAFTSDFFDVKQLQLRLPK